MSSSYPSLEKGHIADMYHAGTRRYYRVSVIEETYPFEQEPATTFGGIAGGGGAPRQLRVSPKPSHDHDPGDYHGTARQIGGLWQNF